MATFGTGSDPHTRRHLSRRVQPRTTLVNEPHAWRMTGQDSANRPIFALNAFQNKRCAVSVTPSRAPRPERRAIA